MSEDVTEPWEGGSGRARGSVWGVFMSEAVTKPWEGGGGRARASVWGFFMSEDVTEPWERVVGVAFDTNRLTASTLQIFTNGHCNENEV